MFLACARISKRIIYQSKVNSLLVNFSWFYYLIINGGMLESCREEESKEEKKGVTDLSLPLFSSVSSFTGFINRFSGVSSVGLLYV